MNSDDRTTLEEVLGYRFQRPELLRLALTHSSYAREVQSGGSAEAVADNEQMEFLGDSVLSFAISAELVQRFPHFREGALSKLRAHLVSEKHLAEIAQRFGIGDYLQLGRGEEKSGGRGKATLLCDALEAILAAVYLDGGIECVRRLILERILDPELERLNVAGESPLVTDYKSALQELIQANSRQHLSYTVVAEEGPEHKKSFTVEVRLLDASSPEKAMFVRRAVGPTKKKAEQDAARQILKHLKDEHLKDKHLDNRDLPQAESAKAID
jgi:ribonuclease-3